MHHLYFIEYSTSIFIKDKQNYMNYKNYKELYIYKNNIRILSNSASNS